MSAMPKSAAGPPQAWLFSGRLVTWAPAAVAPVFLTRIRSPAASTVQTVNSSCGSTAIRWLLRPNFRIEAGLA